MAGNWKMNLNHLEAIALVQKLAFSLTSEDHDKVECVVETRAEVCAAADNSCLMQIGGLLSRRGSPVRCLHLAEILAATGEGAPRR